MVAEGLVEVNVFARMRAVGPRDAAAHRQRRGDRASPRPRPPIVATMPCSPCWPTPAAGGGELAHVNFGDVTSPSGHDHFRVCKSRARTVALEDRGGRRPRRWMRGPGVRHGNLWSSAGPHSLVNTVVPAALGRDTACPRPAPSLCRHLARQGRQRGRVDEGRRMGLPGDDPQVHERQSRRPGPRRDAPPARLTAYARIGPHSIPGRRPIKR